MPPLREMQLSAVQVGAAALGARQRREEEEEEGKGETRKNSTKI